MKKSVNESKNVFLKSNLNLRRFFFSFINLNIIKDIARFFKIFFSVKGTVKSLQVTQNSNGRHKIIFLVG